MYVIEFILYVVWYLKQHMYVVEFLLCVIQFLKQHIYFGVRFYICHADSWSLSHLGYLYPRTTPVMIKLDHNRSCPWV